jgi:hypothetical protein
MLLDDADLEAKYRIQIERIGTSKGADKQSQYEKFQVSRWLACSSGGINLGIGGCGTCR